MTDSDSSGSFLEPHPSDWLTPARIQYITEHILPSAGLLEFAELLDRLLLFWLKSEIVAESTLLMHADSSFSEDEAEILWARHHWQSRLQSLYLDNKKKLDLISYKILRVPSLYLAFELYHRLKASEADFDNLCYQYSVGNERFRGGRVDNQSLSDFPLIMQSAFYTMSRGDLYPPVKFGENYAVVMFVDFKPSSFDQLAENKLLKWELIKWHQSMLPELRSHLKLSQ